MVANERRLVLAAIFLAIGIAGLLVAGGIVVAEEHADNETVHEHPDRVESEGDDSTERWLSRELESLLGGSAIALSEGEYDRARELVDEEYRQRLSEYVEIADDVGEDEEEKAEETTDLYQEYLDEREAFEETYADYQEAADAGNDAEARAHARELSERAERLDTLANKLLANYEDLDELLGINLEEILAILEEDISTVESTREEVERAEFEETTVVLDSYDNDISFSSPLEVSGEVRNASGAPVDGGEVHLSIDGDRQTAEVGADGSFSIQLRPVTARTDTENASLNYSPDPTSAYLESEQTLAVSIEQETPTVEITDATSSAAFGETIELTGSFHVDGVPVTGLPLEVVLDEQTIDNVETTGDGQFSVQATLGAKPPAGDHGLFVDIPDDGLAIGNNPAEHTIRIEETEANIALDARENADGYLVAEGELLSSDGEPLPGQEIVVTVEGSDVTVSDTTDEDGAFAITTSGDPLPSGEEIIITGSFSGEGTNLGMAETSETVTLSPPDPRDPESTNIEWLLAGLIVILLVVGYVVYQRKSGSSEGAIHQRPGDVRPSSESVSDGSRRGSLDLAIASKREDTDAAIRIAYHVARGELADLLDSGRAATHWEFYRRAASSGISAIDDLQTLTECYEMATFAPEGSSEEDASRAIEAVRTLRRSTVD